MLFLNENNNQSNVGYKALRPVMQRTIALSFLMLFSWPLMAP
jgi:hypothetical protein